MCLSHAAEHNERSLVVLSQFSGPLSAAPSDINL
jgi:hypothetical protein